MSVTEVSHLWVLYWEAIRADAERDGDWRAAKTAAIQRDLAAKRERAGI